MSLKHPSSASRASSWTVRKHFGYLARTAADRGDRRARCVPDGVTGRAAHHGPPTSGSSTLLLLTGGVERRRAGGDATATAGLNSTSRGIEPTATLGVCRKDTADSWRSRPAGRWSRSRLQDHALVHHNRHAAHINTIDCGRRLRRGEAGPGAPGRVAAPPGGGDLRNERRRPAPPRTGALERWMGRPREWLRRSAYHVAPPDLTAPGRPSSAGW